MGAGRDMVRDRVGRINPKPVGALHIGGERIAMRQHESCHAIGQRRLAYSCRTSDQPSVRNAPAAVGIQQCRLGFTMPEQLRSFARMNGCDLRLDLTGAHAEFATLPGLAAKKRSRKATHMLAATVPASALASISTHRCGSLAAICRYASRNS